MAAPKKGIAMLVLEHAKKKGMMGPASEPSEEDAEMAPDAGVESAMSDFMSALKADDVGGAVEAWKSLCELE